MQEPQTLLPSPMGAHHHQKSASTVGSQVFLDTAEQLSMEPMTPKHPGKCEEETVDYVFPDFMALDAVFGKEEYEVVTIQGFEIYIVEQWACERKYSTVITSYTGDDGHKIKAGRVSLPLNTKLWSERLIRFVNEIESSGAKLKETEFGQLYITNLSSFPSNLNLIPVPAGCVLDVWDIFKVNVNMRRMNCGGRSALFLCPPSDACEDKFRQIYKTHPKVDITYAIKELVTLVQICLVDFKLLDPMFVDGLLCNKTEEKIVEWWNLFGSVYYGVVPKDGILGPTTVSAILGFVLSCHYRLDMASVDFPKEPFNYFSYRVNVGKFQRQYNLTRTWYLDPMTVEKLFRVTSKNSTSDISKLKKVVKSTVHDISGKASSEQSAKEVLTTDLEKAIKYFHCSPRLEYLWMGKGDLRDLKQFEYNTTVNTGSSTLMSASTLKSGVGKIKNLPKRLQNDEVLVTPATPVQDKEPAESSSEEEDSHLMPMYTQQLDTHTINLLTDDETFKRSLNRRLSFPYLPYEVNTHQLPYENHTTDFHSSTVDSQILKRSKSFSFIQDAIEAHSTLPIPECIARETNKIEQYTLCSRKSWSQYCEEVKQHRQQLKEAQSQVFRLTQITKPVLHSCELQIQADERYHSKLLDIDTTGARLEYEMRLLATRVRDSQDSVDNFVRKVEALEQAIVQTCPEEGSKGSIDTERIVKVWRMIEQFGPVQWMLKWGAPTRKEE